MKQVIKCLGFAFFCCILALILKTPSIRAFASVEFGSRIEVVDSIPPGSDPTLQIGDIKITVTILNNTGIACGGVSFNHSSNDLSLLYEYDKPNKILAYPVDVGINIIQHITDYGNEEGLSVGFMSSISVTDTGDFFYYYVRPKNNTFDYTNMEDYVYGVIVDRIVETDNTLVQYTVPDTFEYILPISYTVANPYTFMLGDINGDGYVTVEDVQLLVQLYHISQTEELDVDGTYTVSSTTYPGLYISINGTPTLVLRVADVNRDCVINEDDAWDLLAYYTEVVVSGQPYDGEIGQMQTHIKYIIQFS